MNYRILHQTTYEYGVSAEACHNLVRLQPRSTHRQTCRETTLRIDPDPDTLHSRLDYFGNRVHGFSIYEPHLKLSITAESFVKLLPQAEVPHAPSPPWNHVAEQLRADRSPKIVEALEFVFASRYIRLSEGPREFAAPFFTTGRPLCESVEELTRAIHDEFKYDPEVTTVGTPVEEVLEKRSGVCQDFAHLEIACLRSFGLACRYVSGYLRTDPRPGQPRLVGADASHAWISVFCPNHGWVDFDPTNGCRAHDRHVTIGWGLDFHDVSPVKGVVLGGGESTLSVAVDVVPVE